MNCSPAGSSVHGIFQARILEWVAIFCSRGSLQPKDQIWVSGTFCTADGFLITQPLGKPCHIQMPNQIASTHSCYLCYEFMNGNFSELNSAYKQWRERIPVSKEEEKWHYEVCPDQHCEITECVYVCTHMPMLSCVWLFAIPWTVAHQVPLSMEFSSQEYWNGLPLPTPGDLPKAGIEPSSSLSGRFVPLCHPVYSSYA